MVHDLTIHEANFRAEYSNSRALIVGIDVYEKLSPLRHAANDAKAIANLLIKEFGFGADQITLLLDQDATKENISAKYLSYTSSDIDRDERLLVYFAGHGWTKTGYDGEVGYLVPHDGDLKELSSLVRWDDLTINTDLIPAKHILFVMDACYGGLAITRDPMSGDKRFIADMLTRRGRQVLTAGKANETVADSGGPVAGHSVFTGHLIQALSGEAEDDQGSITATHVISYVYRKVSVDRKSKQTPHYGFLEGDGDFVFRAPGLNIRVQGDYPLKHYRRSASTKFAARFEDTLVAQLQETDIDARILAVQQIGAALEQGYDDTPKIAAELLGHAIADEDEEVRANALYLFAEHGLLASTESVEMLRKHLRDGSGEIRRLAASSLGNAGAIAKAATVELIEALNDDDEWVGEEAAFALNSIGNSARSALRNMENKAFAQRYNELLDGEGRSVEF